MYRNINELIGNTPIIQLNNIKSKYALSGNIFAKIEYFNPAGSIKDRVAYNMIVRAEEQGLIQPNTVIIEPTSGNTGIGLAMVCAVKGYRCIIVMPSNMSIERIRLMKAYGAEVILTDSSLGMTGAICKAEELKEQFESVFIPGQFSNFENPNAHYLTTAREMYSQLDVNIDYVVLGVGTGGTITGVAKYLKERIPNVKIVGVEPQTSALLSGQKAGAHSIQGIGAGFVPDVLDLSLIDEIITVSDQLAYEYARTIAKVEGIFVGISSGCALCASVQIARREQDKNIVTIFPDGGSRYLSTEGFIE